MSRRVFISFDHAEQLGPRGFNVESRGGFSFAGRHLADPERAHDPAFVKDQLSRCAVTVVLFDRSGHSSDWIPREIEWSLEKGHGLVGVRLDPDATPPEPLYDAGAEILDWTAPADVSYFPTAIEAAIASAALLRRAATRGTGSGASCARPTARMPD
jgi:antiphage defense system Thoeris ThsB-like protein